MCRLSNKARSQLKCAHYIATLNDSQVRRMVAGRSVCNLRYNGDEDGGRRGARLCHSHDLRDDEGRSSSLPLNIKAYQAAMISISQLELTEFNRMKGWHGDDGWGV